MCVLINFSFPLRCQERRLIYISINLLSAAMIVLLGKADKHRSVGMGVGPNINTLLRTAAERARAPGLGALRCERVRAGIRTPRCWVPLQGACIWKPRTSRVWRGISPPASPIALCWGLALAVLAEDKALGRAPGLRPFHSFSDGQGTLHKLPTNFLQANQRP